MPIAIVLRTSGSHNVFRDTIVNVLATPGSDKAILCSGFFQENFKGSAYRASSELGLASVVAASGVELTTIGIHNHSWKKAYIDFKTSMQSAAGSRVSCKYKSGMRWHAKVFIASKGGVPHFGIVGSSNLTRPAFSITSKKDFNNECDVILWENSSPAAAAGVGATSRLATSIVIKGRYHASDNQGATISNRLQEIWDAVLDQDLKDLE